MIQGTLEIVVSEILFETLILWEISQFWLLVDLFFYI